jgi:signal transduction histidine kinase/DNA-binding response OmpR family regulator
VRYRYLLEGYEQQWHLNGRNRIASYTNVPPGSYLFRVRSLDEANPESYSERTLRIVILPPWWLTWWAYIIYTILGVALFYGVLRLIFFFARMKNEVYIGQRLAELKIKFFTNISHELRTPLTLIKTPIRELKENEPLSDKGRQYLDLMERHANQMLQLVNQLLDFRKIQNNKMRLHVSRTDLNKLVSPFAQEFRILAEENEISFNIQTDDKPLYVWVDCEKIQTVIRNLLSNAFKFTPDGGYIFVSTGMEADAPERCYIRVEDSGKGIPANKLSEIFERFSQVEGARNTSVSMQGTGIGLALSHDLVALHHGSIRAESENSRGAVFTVELLTGKEHYKASEVDFYVDDTSADSAVVATAAAPAAGAGVAESDSAAGQSVDSSLPSLLVVEDNRDLGMLLRMQLEGKYNISLATNGVEGLKKIHLYHPDVVVTDLMMPEMSGVEMIKQIRRDFRISHIPVIVLTARYDEEERTRIIAMGANAYITKPFSKDYLVARIEQLLSERKRFRERMWTHDEQSHPDQYEQFLVKKDLQLLEKIHQVIEENIDNSDFNIDSIAAGIGLSRSAFFKKLKSLTGLAPVDLVKEIRLGKSVELIKRSNMSVSEIAFAVGFKDAGYYAKCFRKKYNQSPREYVQAWRKGAGNASTPPPTPPPAPRSDD